MKPISATFRYCRGLDTRWWYAEPVEIESQSSRVAGTYRCASETIKAPKEGKQNASVPGGTAQSTKQMPARVRPRSVPDSVRPHRRCDGTPQGPQRQDALPESRQTRSHPCRSGPRRTRQRQRSPVAIGEGDRWCFPAWPRNSIPRSIPEGPTPDRGPANVRALRSPPPAGTAGTGRGHEAGKPRALCVAS